MTSQFNKRVGQLHKVFFLKILQAVYGTGYRRNIDITIFVFFLAIKVTNIDCDQIQETIIDKNKFRLRLNQDTSLLLFLAEVLKKKLSSTVKPSIYCTCRNIVHVTLYKTKQTSIHMYSAILHVLGYSDMLKVQQFQSYMCLDIWTLLNRLALSKFVLLYNLARVDMERYPLHLSSFIIQAFSQHNIIGQRMRMIQIMNLNKQDQQDIA